MINKSEILQLAKTTNLDPSIIEKDYVLGWILMGIQQHKELSQSWVFKGGTCLKKCYFGQYRFSEDLDFTLTHPQYAEIKTLTKQFCGICAWIYENSGIEITENSIAFELYKNLHGKFSIQGKLIFQGPLQRKTNFPKVKIDLTSHEKIVLSPEPRPIYHPYSDAPQIDIKVFCYCYEELFAEKIRALAERARPRDLYDVIYLYNSRQLIGNKASFVNTLRDKCAFKKIPLPTLDTIQRHPQQVILMSEWNNMLAHQVSRLKPFVDFWSKLPEIFDWLYKG
jgi:predicted nucleotidyltransferase component of viral defense system